MDLGLLSPDAHKGLGEHPGRGLVARLSSFLDLTDKPSLLSLQRQELTFQICQMLVLSEQE